MKSKITAIVLAASMLSTQAWAGCMATPEKTALKIETLQQELMVAGLICNDANPYNAFVLANRPELIQSDHDLQAFYTKMYQSSGTDQFQAVKTRLANHFSLDSLHNQDGFCRTAASLFTNLHEGAPLSTQVSWIAVNDTKESCESGAPIVETVDVGSSGPPPQTQIAARVAQNTSPPNYGSAGGPNPNWQGPPPGYAPGYYPPPPQYAPRGSW